MDLLRKILSVAALLGTAASSGCTGEATTCTTCTTCAPGDSDSCPECTTLTAPQITSSPVTAATSGEEYAYTIAVTGEPSPVVTVTGLPGWLHLSGLELRGTPAWSDEGISGPIVLTAGNGVEPAATQSFSVDVGLPALNAVTLAAGTVNDWEGHGWQYENLRLEVAGKQPSYAIWLPGEGSQPAAAIMTTYPYMPIGWTGDAIDEQEAAAQGFSFDAEACMQENGAFLINECAALCVFGRFYTGGDLENDVDDMVAGLRWLGTVPAQVDTSRIGIRGSSWGGFESLYAATHAPLAAVPAAGVADYPPSDFVDWVNYVALDGPSQISSQSERAAFESFFAPFLERVYATTGGPVWDPAADYSPWTAAHVAAHLRTPFLVVHDQLDVLVPFEQSAHLAANSDKITPLYFLWHQPRDLDFLKLSHGHGDLRFGASPGFVLPFHATAVVVFLLDRVAASDQQLLIPYDPAALGDFLTYVKTEQDAGTPVEWAADVLLDLVDARVILLDMNWIAPFELGNVVLAREVNAVWDTSYTAEEIAGVLAAGLP